MSLDRLLAEGQTESRRIVMRRSTDVSELLEQCRQRLGRDAAAVVGAGEGDFTGAADVGVDDDACARTIVLEGVEHKVDEHSLDEWRVDAHVGTVPSTGPQLDSPQVRRQSDVGSHRLEQM